MGLRHYLIAVSALAAVLALLPAPALAQSQGPLVLLPSNDRTVVAPEVKITDINGTTGTLVGIYAGRELDRRLFLGGAGYWLADPRDTTRLFYLGFIAGWQLADSDRVHVGVRGFLGGGDATVYTYETVPVGGRHPGPGWGYASGWVGWRDSVLVAEPEIRAEFDLSDRVRVSVGGGYRATSGAGWFGDRLNGATGSFSVQFGLGK
jgi:hypothetical protein